MSSIVRSMFSLSSCESTNARSAPDSCERSSVANENNDVNASVLACGPNIVSRIGPNPIELLSVPSLLVSQRSYMNVATDISFIQPCGPRFSFSVLKPKPPAVPAAPVSQ